MRILQLGKFYPIRGGVEKVMWNITRALSERGVACDMLCARLRGDADDVDDAPFSAGDGGFIFPGGGRVFCAKALAKVAGTMLSPSMIGWLRRNKGDYDLIHIHHPDPMAALALRMSGFRGRVVLHWHSDIVTRRFLLFLFRPLQRWMLKRADRIIVTTPVYGQESPWLRDFLQKCVSVPIGIDPLPVHQETVDALCRRYSGKTVLFSMGRFVPYKGLPTLVEAMRYLPDRFHLILGGSGPLWQKIKQIVQDGLLQGRIEMPGYISSDDLGAYFKSCNIFVLPSIWKTEAFGIVQLEAMSFGKPVVCCRIPGSGVSWVNQDGISGKTVPPGDARALASAILEVEEQYEPFSEGAVCRYRNMFRKETMINKIMSIYEELL